MQQPSTAQSIYRLVIVGEQVGFTFEQMIKLLNGGLTVETLLRLIESRLRDLASGVLSSSRWIM